MGARSRITDEQIVAAAREVFLRDGVDAPTAAVAAHAGVSEALVFKRFGTRDELLQQVFAPVVPSWQALLVERPDDIEDTLVRVAVDMIDSMRREMPMAMLAWSKSPHDHWADHPGEPPPVTGMKHLAAWFEGQMRAGRMRRSDPELLARVFSGAVVAYSMSEMTGLAVHMPLASTTFARGLVDVIWNGASPRPEARQP